jgi:hypothetical protein
LAVCCLDSGIFGFFSGLGSFDVLGGLNGLSGLRRQGPLRCDPGPEVVASFLVVAQVSGAVFGTASGRWSSHNDGRRGEGGQAIRS